jgi:hypothetical protein
MLSDAVIRRARFLAAAAAAALLGLAPPAAAEVGSPPTVRLYVAAAGPVLAAVVERLRPRLAAMGVELTPSLVASVDVEAVLETVPAAGDAAPLAQVWLDGRSSSDAVLILVPRRADRVLARRVASGAVFDEVALSEIVFVIERATASLLASRPVGVPKAEAAPELRRRPPSPVPETAAAATPTTSPASPEEPQALPAATTALPPAAASPPLAPPPGPPPALASDPLAPLPLPPPEAAPAAARASEAKPSSASRSPPTARDGRARAFSQMGAYAGGESWATGATFVATYGLDALVERVTGPRRLGASLDAELRGSADVGTPFGNVDLSGGATHLLLSYGRSFGAGVGRIALGPGVAFVTVRATPAPGGGTARPRTDLDWTLALLARWDFPLTRALTAFGALGLDVALDAGRYTDVVDGVSTSVLTTWRVRPTVRVGFALGR